MSQLNCQPRLLPCKKPPVIAMMMIDDADDDDDDGECSDIEIDEDGVW